MMSHLLRLSKNESLKPRRFLILYIRAVSCWITIIATTLQTQALESDSWGQSIGKRKPRVTSSGTYHQLPETGMWPHTATEIFEIADPDLRIEWHGAKGACTI